MCKVVQVTGSISTTTAFTHQSSMGVAHCSMCTEQLAKVRQEHRFPLEQNLGMFVTAVVNIPHFQVKPSSLIHVWKNLPGYELGHVSDSMLNVDDAPVSISLSAEL